MGAGRGRFCHSSLRVSDDEEVGTEFGEGSRVVGVQMSEMGCGKVRNLVVSGNEGVLEGRLKSGLRGDKGVVERMLNDTCVGGGAGVGEGRIQSVELAGMHSEDWEYAGGVAWVRREPPSLLVCDSLISSMPAAPVAVWLQVEGTSSYQDQTMNRDWLLFWLRFLFLYTLPY